VIKFGIMDGEESPQCKGGIAMKYCEFRRLLNLATSVIFSVLMAVSLSSFGQETSVSPGPLSVEIEQVNINHADASTIARVLDGVGLSRAEAIVNFREEYGNFVDAEDLLLVRGVGEVTLRNNQDRISFD
jgi:competence protein ComEA